MHYVNAVLAGRRQRAVGRPVASRRSPIGGWVDLGHRHVVFDDAEAGERAATQLASEGWERTRIAFMVFAGNPAGVTEDPRARAISEPEMEALQLASVRDGRPRSMPGTAWRRAWSPHSAACAGRPARTASGRASPRNELASMCTLFLDPDVDGRRVAMLTDVGTRPPIASAVWAAPWSRRRSPTRAAGARS